VENSSGVAFQRLKVVEKNEKPSLPHLPAGECRILEDTDTLLQVISQWTLLANHADQPTHHFAWLNSCAATFTRIAKPIFFSVGGSQPTALAPLVQNGNRLEVLGVEQLYEPTDFPHFNEAALQKLANAVAQSRYALSLKRVQADSAVIDALRLAYHGRGLVITRPVAGCPWIPLDDTWIDPESKLSAGRRSSMRRARKSAERLGRVLAEINCVTEKNLTNLLEEAFRIEASGWKGRSGTALASDPLRKAFYEQFVREAFRAGILRLSVLRIGDRGAAMQIAVECGERFWLLKVGFDEAFSKCGPGNLLMLETLKYAASRKLKSYEFLGTSDQWTQIWTNLVRPCVSIMTYPRSWQGMSGLTSDCLSFAFQRLSRTFA